MGAVRLLLAIAVVVGHTAAFGRIPAAEGSVRPAAAQSLLRRAGLLHHFRLLHGPGAVRKIPDSGRRHPGFSTSAVTSGLNAHRTGSSPSRRRWWPFILTTPGSSPAFSAPNTGTMASRISSITCSSWVLNVTLLGQDRAHVPPSIRADGGSICARFAGVVREHGEPSSTSWPPSWCGGGRCGCWPWPRPAWRSAASSGTANHWRVAGSRSSSLRICISLSWASSPTASTRFRKMTYIDYSIVLCVLDRRRRVIRLLGLRRLRLAILCQRSNGPRQHHPRPRYLRPAPLCLSRHTPLGRGTIGRPVLPPYMWHICVITTVPADVPSGGGWLYLLLSLLISTPRFDFSSDPSNAGVSNDKASQT